MLGEGDHAGHVRERSCCVQVVKVELFFVFRGFSIAIVSPDDMIRTYVRCARRPRRRVEKLLAADEGAYDLERVSRRLAERIEFQRLRVVGEYDRSGAWAADRFVSTASAVRSKLRCSHGKAHRLVRLARKLEHLPETAAAFAAGEITGEHVAEIARPYTPERAEMLEGIEAELVAFARISTPGGTARRACSGWSTSSTVTAAPAPTRSNTQLNKVTLSTTSGGRGILNGSLDPELTDLVQTALDAEMEVLRQRAETRTSPQLRAAALESIAREYLAGRGESTARGRGRTNVNIVVRHRRPRRQSIPRSPRSPVPMPRTASGCRARRSSGSCATATSAG